MKYNPSSVQTFYTGEVTIPDTHNRDYWNMSPAYAQVLNILTAIEKNCPGTMQEFLHGKGAVLEVKPLHLTPLALLSTPVGSIWNEYRITHSIEIQIHTNTGIIETLVIGQNGYPIGYDSGQGIAYMVLEAGVKSLTCHGHNKREVIPFAQMFERMMRHHYLIPARKRENVVIHSV